MALPIDGMIYSFKGSLPARAGLSAQYLLARILVGGGTIKKESGHAAYTQMRDLYCWPSVPQVKSSSVAASEFIKDQTGRSVSNFIGVTTADNRKLFGELLSEISNSFSATAVGSHTSAFVHIYRALERLSFSIPLLYCATATDFFGTFNELKKLFDDGPGGDLSLLRKFIEGGRFLDRTVVDTTITLDFSASPNNAENFYKAVSTRFSAADLCDPTRQQIDVRFGKMQLLLETLRNRFFHFRTGDARDNISSKDLVDVDEFFSFINPPLMNYIAKLSLQAIAVKYRG